MISWLITECDADVNALDLAGRLPGEANLSLEAPNLQPTTLAIEIKEMLEDARQGRFPGTPKNDTSTTASSPDGPEKKPHSEPVAATGDLESPPATSNTEQPTMTLDAGDLTMPPPHRVNDSALATADENTSRQASRSVKTQVCNASLRDRLLCADSILLRSDNLMKVCSVIKRFCTSP